MSNPVPSDPKTTPASADPVDAPTSGHPLHEFWQKNSHAISLLCLIVIIAILGKNAFDFYQTSRRQSIAADYAAASTPEKLKAFAASNRGNELGGVANLRLADDAYAASNYSLAVQLYQTAMESLKDEALLGRARLGIAVSKVQGGQSAEGETQLKALANEAKQLKPIRAEAYYHLALLATTAGKTDDATKYLDLLNTLEPAGFWAQRALALRSTLPAPAASTAAAAPEIKLPGKP
jgi:predicted negative regulator of RcsB-dependent stress response